MPTAALVGSGSIQGARLAGAALDLVEGKHAKAFQFGATHFTTSPAEATDTVADLTRGVMANSAIIIVGLVKGPMIDDALGLVSQGGVVVLTSLAALDDVTPTLPPTLPLTLFTLFQKRLLGSRTESRTRAPTFPYCLISIGTASSCSTKSSAMSTNSGDQPRL